MEFFGDLSVPVTFVIAVVVALAILGAAGPRGRSRVSQ